MGMPNEIITNLTANCSDNGYFNMVFIVIVFL